MQARHIPKRVELATALEAFDPTITSSFFFAMIATKLFR